MLYYGSKAVNEGLPTFKRGLFSHPLGLARILSHPWDLWPLEDSNVVILTRSRLWATASPSLVKALSIKSQLLHLESRSIHPLFPTPGVTLWSIKVVHYTKKMGSPRSSLQRQKSKTVGGALSDSSQDQNKEGYNNEAGV